MVLFAETGTGTLFRIKMFEASDVLIQRVVTRWIFYYWICYIETFS
jgi:hypothetical protein